MKLWRVSNIKALSTLPYQLLSECEKIEYLEANPAENARMLHEREVDIALIPITEFVMYGDYLALDFGIASRKKATVLSVFAEQPIESLHTIFLDIESQSAVMLLRLLLKEKWKKKIKLVRTKHSELFSRIREGVGSLVIGDDALKNIDTYPYRIDLGEEWYKMTGLPFVFCVWAGRREVLNREWDQTLSQYFYKADTVRSSLFLNAGTNMALIPNSSIGHLVNDVIFRLDDDCLKSMELFFSLSCKHRLLPRGRYVSAKYNLSSGLPKYERKDIGDLFEAVLNGARLTVADAKYLVEEKEYSTEVLMVADTIRHNHHPNRGVTYFLKLDTGRLRDPTSLELDVLALVGKGISPIIAVISEDEFGLLGNYSKLVTPLKGKYPIYLAFESPIGILKYSREKGLSITSLVEVMRDNGVDYLCSKGCGMLVERYLRRRFNGEITSQDVLSVMKWFHNLGGRSFASVEISNEETWEDRLLHLLKLRTSQDETPGIESVEVIFNDSRPNQEHEKIIEKLKAVAITRIFMDNVVTVREKNYRYDHILGALGLCAGADDVSIHLSYVKEQEQNTTIRSLARLAKLGMQFDRSLKALLNNV